VLATIDIPKTPFKGGGGRRLENEVARDSINRVVFFRRTWLFGKEKKPFSLDITHKYHPEGENGGKVANHLTNSCNTAHI
jgi:hypothetical protein